MEITQDRFQLPVAVADSAAELARIVGTTKGNVATIASRMASGEKKRGRFVRVDIEEDKENEND